MQHDLCLQSGCTGTRCEFTIHMIGELSTEEMERVLRDEVVGRIGCHARGDTYVVPVTYVYDGSSIISHTGEGLKIRMMRENPKVCFEVDQLGHLPSWRSVIVRGLFEELRDKELELGLQHLVERLRVGPAAVPGHGAGVYVATDEPGPARQSIVLAIRIRDMTGRFETSR